jgi:phage terminase large subunit-like protein
MGIPAFNAQYQQNPSVGGGALFKPEYFPLYDKVLHRHQYEYILQTWDAASSLSESASYSVCMTFGVTNNQLHLLHVFRARKEYPELKAAAEKLIDAFGPTHVFVEFASLGQSLATELKAKYGAGVYIDIPKKSKFERAQSLLYVVTAARVSLPKADFYQSPFMNALKTELYTFPVSPHTDQVDALVLGLHFLVSGIFCRPAINYKGNKPSMVGFCPVQWNFKSLYDVLALAS